MTSFAVSHQGAIQKFWFHYRGAVMSEIILNMKLENAKLKGSETESGHQINSLNLPLCFLFCLFVFQFCTILVLN